MVRINRAMLTGDVRIGAVVATPYVSFHHFLIGTYRVVSYTLSRHGVKPALMASSFPVLAGNRIRYGIESPEAA